VAILCNRQHRQRDFAGVPILGATDLAPQLARTHARLIALIVLSDLHAPRPLTDLLRDAQTFRQVLIVPDLGGIGSLGISAQDLGGMLGLDVRQRLLDPGRLAIKRLLDLTLIALGAPLALLLTAVIAVAIKLDSRGPVFFTHERIGRDGRHFKAWKFRTMYALAHDAPADTIPADPRLREEWKLRHKLAADPRVTRLGRYLRRMSLDELPQLWNVVRGEMSLVGPRPIIDEEVRRYGDDFALFTRVTPGITGLWQVSGRNDLTYAERVRLDVYYVRNWSVWLDLYLLASTIRAVITGRGAY
jgi:Undecaprenyl-phosphate galactose phosphotransferase WbaP